MTRNDDPFILWRGMLGRDDRPYFDTELGIPYHELQMATWVAIEFSRVFIPHPLDAEVDDRAERFARRASAALRRGPR